MGVFVKCKNKGFEHNKGLTPSEGLLFQWGACASRKSTFWRKYGWNEAIFIENEAIVPRVWGAGHFLWNHSSNGLILTQIWPFFGHFHWFLMNLRSENHQITQNYFIFAKSEAHTMTGDIQLHYTIKFGWDLEKLYQNFKHKEIFFPRLKTLQNRRYSILLPETFPTSPSLTGLNEKSRSYYTWKIAIF